MSEVQHSEESVSALSASHQKKPLRKKSLAPVNRPTWVGDKRAILRFVLILGALVGAFNACFYLWIIDGSFFIWHLNVYAKVSASILNVLSENVIAVGNSVISPKFSLSVKAECDAVQASAFFVIAVMTSPSSKPIISRVYYIIVGLLLLLFLNLIRIVSLYYTGAYFPGAFKIMHLDVWQAIFIFTPLIMWISLLNLWSHRTKRMVRDTSDVNSKTY